MDSSPKEPSVALMSEVQEGNPESTHIPNTDHQNLSDTIQPFLQKALSSPINTGDILASIFSPISDIDNNLIPQTSHITCPVLETKARNNILLYSGSFNPPHQGHLATIRYFHERREDLGITVMFVFVDPGSIVNSKKKKWGDIILPQNLRYKLFYRVPEISQLVASGWLQLFVGDMNNHIQVLRTMTDLISEAGFEVKLVGLLGGDKLTVESAPHLHPGNLQEWGPVDEFLIINARRPVDFFDPKNEKAPRDLPGCTKWEKGAEESDKLVNGSEGGPGVLWICEASTVPGKPIIQFRASQSSASNGVSSTNIRRIMTEAPDEELMEELKDKVISVELLVEWLQHQRNQKQEVADEKAFL
ncbi:hypothetical protein SBOR_9438 [Sclerotinia borealis F-4128]|uniref:Cytidyltransferase-like domain-containing protein n=1 Tax=Sclerotinia borealis (strain F-4128) TaxID=1432307 RepID=W9C6H4_SCLBF|nr:hypothetical protein SBOR_9438 [Sclerotinia borealis F-4128]